MKTVKNRTWHLWKYVASHEKKWMNKELTSDSMSMAAGERDREVSKEWYVGYEDNHISARHWHLLAKPTWTWVMQCVRIIFDLMIRKLDILLDVSASEKLRGCLNLVKIVLAPCLGHLGGLTVCPSVPVWSQLCCSGHLGPRPQRTEGHWSYQGGTWVYAHKTSSPLLMNRAFSVGMYMGECACMAVCTEGDCHLQTPHCGASNGRSHFSIYQSLQSDVPERDSGIMGIVFKYKLSGKLAHHCAKQGIVGTYLEGGVQLTVAPQISKHADLSFLRGLWYLWTEPWELRYPVPDKLN